MNEILENQYLDKEFYHDIKEVLEQARKRVYRNIQNEMVRAYWQIGKMIVEKQGGEKRAKFGDGLIKELAIQMTKDFGKGFNERNLEQMRKFYLSFQNPNALRTELSWSHYQLLLKLDDESMRTFYLNKAIKERWSMRQLEKEIRAYSYQNHQVNRDIERVSKTPTYKFSKKSPF